MDREEIENRRIMSILEESDSEEDFLGDEEEGEESDNVSERSVPSDTEQECSDNSSDFDIPLSEVRTEIQSGLNSASSSSAAKNNPAPTSRYFGKDGTVWLKTPFRQNVRTRAENIITQLPGVTPEAKSATSELECWDLFFSNDMLQNVLKFTNVRIQRKIESCNDLAKHTYMKECSIEEFKAFIGLLYIAGLNRSGRQNLSDLWSSDGTGVEIFRLVMSQQRFHFIQSCLCFDDDNTRQHRKQLDNLAPIRELFGAFVENCKKRYSPGECLTIDEMLIAFRG